MRRDKASILIASWDTLGWILYREGRYFEAEDFARAAWIDSEHTDIGEHFGDIESKLGNHDVALKTYTLALATLPAKAPPGADAQRLRDKIDAEKRAGAKLEKFDPAAGLIQLRTIPLGPAAGRQGDFRYLILISRDRIEKAQPDGGKGIPGALELMQKGDVKNFTPVSLEVRLPTTATLRCHANACDLTLEP
jgi:tetratricopeptide (TPR) repeat protein